MLRNRANLIIVFLLLLLMILMGVIWVFSSIQKASSIYDVVPQSPEFSFSSKTKKELRDSLLASQLALTIMSGNEEDPLSFFQEIEEPMLSSPMTKSALVLIQSLRREKKTPLALSLLQGMNEEAIHEDNPELALEVAIVKSRCLKEKGEIDQAMSYLAWVINDSSLSPLRIKAMVLRADLYSQLKRPELAIRQLEAAKGKGGEWGVVAEKKLRAIQEEWQGLPVIIRQKS